MKKIKLENYNISGINEKGKLVELPYDVKSSIISVIFHPNLKLDGRQLLLRGKLSDKIEKSNGELLLEDADYEIVKSAFELVTGFGKNDLELVSRVLEAETVEVEVKKI